MEFEPVWDGIIAWYLFLAGLGAGAFVASVWLHRRCPGTAVMVRIGRIVAPVAVCVGLVLLIFDARGGLYNPLRFTLLLSNFGSVMTWGVVFLGGFTVVAAVVLLLDLLKRAVPLWLEVAGVALAVCVAMYTGALLGVCKAFPLWNSALLPLLFLVSGLSAGAAVVLGAGSACLPWEAVRSHSLKFAHWCLIIAELVMLACLLFITGYNSPAGFASVASLTGGAYAGLFWGLLVGCGLVLPIAADAWLLFRPRPAASEVPEDVGIEGAAQDAPEPAGARALAVVADVGVLVGGYTLRYLVIMAAVPLTTVVPFL